MGASAAGDCHVIILDVSKVSHYSIDAAQLLVEMHSAAATEHVQLLLCGMDEVW